MQKKPHYLYLTDCINLYVALEITSILKHCLSIHKKTHVFPLLTLFLVSLRKVLNLSRHKHLFPCLSILFWRPGAVDQWVRTPTMESEKI